MPPQKKQKTRTDSLPKERSNNVHDRKLKYCQSVFHSLSISLPTPSTSQPVSFPRQPMSPVFYASPGNIVCTDECMYIRAHIHSSLSNVPGKPRRWPDPGRQGRLPHPFLGLGDAHKLVSGLQAASVLPPAPSPATSRGGMALLRSSQNISSASSWCIPVPAASWPGTGSSEEEKDMRGKDDSQV